MKRKTTVFFLIIAKEAPLAKWEAIGAVAMNGFCCLLLVGGAVGLFMAQGWARWVTIAGGLLLIFALLVHDVYQIFFYRPVLMEFIDVQFAPGPNPGAVLIDIDPRSGIK